MEDKVYLKVEDSYRETVWCRKCLSGIYAEAKRKRISVCQDGCSKGDIVIILGTGADWVKSVLDTRARSILVSFPLVGSLPNISHISMDYADAVRELIGALALPRIALFGINPASAPDRLKQEGFVSCRKSRGVYDPERDIFYNNGSVEQVCRAFLERAAGYDAVICANEVLCRALSRRLHERDMDIKIATFGEKGREDDGVITAYLDFEEVGRQAVRVFRLLRGNPGLSSVSAMLSCSISCDVPAEDYPVTFDLDLPQVDFYGDREADDILRLERFFDGCDAIDRRIIDYLIENRTYAEIAEALFISEGTVSYRVKKLQAAAKTNSRDALCAFITKYRSS